MEIVIFIIASIHHVSKVTALQYSVSYTTVRDKYMLYFTIIDLQMFIAYWLLF